MKTKEQNISTNTLFAAAIGCFMQLTLGIYIAISPFLFTNLIAAIYGQESAMKIQLFVSSAFINDPITFIIGLICIFIISILFLFAARSVKKNQKIKLWSILSLVSAFLLIHFGTSFLQIAAILGFIGSITGLMHKEEIKK